MTSRSARGAGFTLLEVLVAVAILGLALTVILSSQVGLFHTSQRSAHLSVATELARCRMEETELDLLKRGYAVTTENDEGDCCGDESSGTYHCAWKIDVVELPQPRDPSSLDSADGGTTGGDTGLGALGALATMGQSSSAGLAAGATPGSSGALGGISGMLAGASSAGVQGMAPLVMSLVYPDLKPMLEASIRKITVTVSWKEGRNERDLAITQYVANPMQGGFDPNAAAAVKALGAAVGN